MPGRGGHCGGFAADRFSRGAAAWFRRRGDAWLEAGKAPVLVAPSVIVPPEQNVMVNPRHPQAGRLRVEEEVPSISMPACSEAPR
jgi:RES domain-containing protein